MKSKWTLIAVLLIGVAATAFLVNFALGPRVLRIAVGPLGSTNLRVMVGFLQALQSERAPVRLRLVLTDGTESSSRMMESGRADLAVVRSDIAVPPESGTVAILRSDAVYFITKPGSDLKTISDMRGKSIGLASIRPVNSALLGRILHRYHLEATDVNFIQGTQAEILAKAGAGALDAVFLISPLSDRAGRAVYQAMAHAGGGAPGILPIGQAEAMAEEEPVFSTVEMVRGSLSSDPVQPEEALTTLSVTHRLVARRKLDETLISDTTRLLFALRLVIARETPAANEIELPSVEDRGEKLPVHPGTIAYVEGETKTFFDRFGDWFYIGVMALSLLGSIAAAIWSRMLAARHPLNIAEEQAELLRLIASVQEAPDMATLEAMRGEIEARRTRLLAVITVAPMEPEQAANLRFLLTELRATCAERCSTLASCA